MKKLLLLAALVVFAFALPAFANQPAAPEGPVLMNKTNMPVTFNHSTHTAYSCESCHHPVDGVATYAPCATAGCHDAMGNKEKGVNSYYQAMHKMKGTKYDTCMSCHVDYIKENKLKGAEANALRGCKKSGCHA